MLILEMFLQKKIIFRTIFLKLITYFLLACMHAISNALQMLISNYCGLQFKQRCKSLVGQGSPEQEDVRLWLVQHVVNPPKALLDAKVSPLLLRHAVRLGHKFGKGLWQHNMPVFVLVIFVLVRIVDLL